MDGYQEAGSPEGRQLTRRAPLVIHANSEILPAASARRVCPWAQSALSDPVLLGPHGGLESVARHPFVPAQRVATRKVLSRALWSVGQVQVGSQNLSLPVSFIRLLRTMVLDGPTMTLSSKRIRRSGW